MIVVRKWMTRYLLLALIFALMVVGLAATILWIETDEGRQRALMLNVLLNIPIMLCAMFYFLHLYREKTRQRIETIEARNMELERERAMQKFHLLKNQMNPHFLFNALTSLSSLAYEDADLTSRFAKELSAMYRYLLKTGERQTVTLREELGFVRSYIYLEEIRSNGVLDARIEAGEEVMERQVIPGSIQMLVENALRHNINSPEQPLCVRIVADACNVTVTNNLQLRRNTQGNGIGLSNLQLQYNLVKLDMAINNDGKSFSVRLSYI